MSLAPEGEDGSGLRLEKLRLNFSSCFHAYSEKSAKKKIDFNSRGLFSLCELRLYLPLDVQRKCCEWIKLATTNFEIVGAKKTGNPRDVASSAAFSAVIPILPCLKDLFTVSDAILTGRQRRLEITVFVWESDVKINFINLRFWTTHELETLGTRQRILLTKCEECGCVRRRPVVF